MSMRVTDSYLSTILVGDLNRSLGMLLKHQRTAGTMRRINSFADDPRAISSINRYNALIENNNQYLNNISQSRIIVDATDTALQSISDVLADLRVISMRESSAIATPQSMTTSNIEVDNLMNRLMDVLNTTVEGNYIFSGQEINTPPFVRNNDTVTYQGDSNNLVSRTGPNSTMNVNLTGDVFMGSQSSVLAGTSDMAPLLVPTTNLNDVNLGNGWDPGSISITDGNGTNWQIDLSSSTDMADVLSTINTATGGAVTASISASGESLEFNGTGPLRVEEVGDGTTANSLGIKINSDSSSMMTGRDIRAGAEGTTALADIAHLAGNLPLGEIEVLWQGNTYTVDLSGATTLDDLKTTLAGIVPGMEISINASSISVIGSSPESFSISSPDGSNTASILGIQGSGSPVRLFGLFEDMKASLQAGDQDGIRNALQELKSVENMVYQMMMKVGGRQVDLDWSDSILRQRDERLRANLALEQDADVAQVAADLSRAETSYQASLLVTSKLYESNLMQYLR